MKYDTSKYKIKTWKNFTLLHWIINPGLAINELVLGQRVPRVMLIDKTSDKPLMERTYVPCPHCGTRHDGRTWSSKNGTAYKNWFGYYCPECGGIIPCLHNATAYLLMIITFPVWGWFKSSWKAKWLEKQPARYENITFGQVRHSDIAWWKIGLRFGGFMYVFMTLFFLILEPSEFSYVALISIPLWLCGGLAFGYIMKFWMGRRGEPEANSS